MAKIRIRTSTRYINYDSSSIEVEVTCLPVLSRDNNIAFDWSDADTYKTVDTFLIESPASQPTSFETEEDGVQYFLSLRGPDIETAVETATTLSFTTGIHLRESAENWFVDKELQDAVQAMEGTVSTLSS